MFPTQFTGASFTWERKKLGDVAEKVIQKNNNNAFKNVLTNSAEYGIISQRDFFERNIANKNNISTYYIVQNDDFVYNPRISNLAPYGPINRNKTGYTGIISPLYYVFRVLNINTAFIEWYFKTTCWHKFMYQHGDSGARSDRFSIKDNELKKLPIKLPADDMEQEKIAKTLTSLDNTLQLHEDHLQFLHSFKSFLLQKMFFDNDIPPLLRFNKFTEKWNQCKLNDHTIVTMGQSPNSKNYTNNQTGKILVQGNADLYKNKILKRVFTTEVTKTAVKNDILISVRAPVGDIARNQYESVVIGRGIASIKGNDFLYYQLEKMKNNGFWNKYIAGSTFESITGKDLKNTKIYTTNSDEERKIGNIFSSLTKIIQLQEHKIDSLKKLKQFLLQNMFI
ncbi:restriction endonuclease subunit S [Ligilactobacillus salivarius]|uniref:restriction endonuclease subunit S n=4 Tax=Ligilactobacillus salivarius TaxID=1624 RepID=UPI000E4724F5|nr:restriction endonuclease subunit S [Ligilactobacillus salivarius]MDE1499651.1 restriction endonuclease subunit S [Ligilactobacillus salivarius]MYU77570.1 restriction endonuclease subunit S [Ligilactobacillus salivarius]MYY50098.1 restriction endonuclease subunit S [Ligilactobacillus salivarius]NGG71333.1 restriction endonuclease subunit S [Ligilactobacillus salivarius]RHF36382.1 restriction endonuclease subunit S [Ligilactobacillus salivarius]